MTSERLGKWKKKLSKFSGDGPLGKSTVTLMLVTSLRVLAAKDFPVRVTDWDRLGASPSLRTGRYSLMYKVELLEVLIEEKRVLIAGAATTLM